MSYTPPAGDAADFSWDGAQAYTAPAGDAADLSFAPLGNLAWLAADGPLGAPALLGELEISLGYVQADGPLGQAAVLGRWLLAGWAAAGSPLGGPAVLAQLVRTGQLQADGPLGAVAVWARLPTTGTLTAPAILGECRVLVLHDFTGQLGDTLTRYVMDLVTPSGLVRVPISSWQATLQQGRANYVQCVVPAVSAWVATIGAATEFVLTRQAVLPDGSMFEYEMARAPVGEARFDRGPTNYTCTLSGYSPGFAVDEEPSGAAARVLTYVRSISSGSGGRRVRCAIDWLLRPGQLASFEGSDFTAAYINYYVQGRDAYMDVGERV
jgi:hypothetical protein